MRQTNTSTCLAPADCLAVISQYPVACWSIVAALTDGICTYVMSHHHMCISCPTANELRKPALILKLGDRNWSWRHWLSALSHLHSSTSRYFIFTFNCQLLHHYPLKTKSTHFFQDNGNHFFEWTAQGFIIDSEIMNRYIHCVVCCTLSVWHFFFIFQFIKSTREFKAQ